MSNSNKEISDNLKSKSRKLPDDRFSPTEHTSDKSNEVSLPSSYAEGDKYPSNSLICRSEFTPIHRESGEQLLPPTNSLSPLSLTVEGSFKKREPMRDYHLLRFPYYNNVVNLKEKRRNVDISKEFTSHDQQKLFSEEPSKESPDWKCVTSEDTWKPNFEPDVNSKFLVSGTSELTASEKNIYKKQQRLAKKHQKKSLLACTTEPRRMFAPHQQCGSISSSTSSRVKNHCLLRTGLLRHKLGDRDLGSCCHFGDGYILSCLHCIIKNGEILDKKTLKVVFHDCDAQLKIYDVNGISRINREYDVVILQLRTSKEAFPPSFEHFERGDVRNEELDVFIGGYQHDYSVNKTYGEFKLDQTVKLQKPSNQEIKQTQDDIVQLYGDNFRDNYSKLYRPEIECVKSCLISGASGGPVVFLDQDNNVKLLMLYQQGHPEHYYKLHIEERKTFESRYLVETGIVMSTVINDMPKWLQEKLKLAI